MFKKKKKKKGRNGGSILRAMLFYVHYYSILGLWRRGPGPNALVVPVRHLALCCRVGLRAMPPCYSRVSARLLEWTSHDGRQTRRALEEEGIGSGQRLPLRFRATLSGPLSRQKMLRRQGCGAVVWRRRGGSCEPGVTMTSTSARQYKVLINAFG